MKRLYYVLVCYLSWFLFAFFGLLLNLVCLPLLLLPRSEGRARRMRQIIRFLFHAWLRWFQFTGALRVSWRGFEKPLDEGLVYVANHPTLIDAPFLLARLPNTVCIFKRKLLRNPAVGPAAVLAGFIGGEHGVELLREAAASVSAGKSFLVFPEGTRTTPGKVIEPLKPGFALVALRARAPVQLILIRASEGLVPRGRAWWRPPSKLPAHIELELDRRWEPEEGLGTHEFAARVEARMREALGRDRD